MTLSDDDKKKYKEVQRLSAQGNAETWVPLLREIVETNPGNGLLEAMLANGYWELNDYDRSANHFAAAVCLSPKSEEISLAYFHFLHERGLRREAEQEMRRFMKSHDSEEYRQLADTLKVTL